MKVLSSLSLFFCCCLLLLSGCGHSSAQAVFDVPSLIGKDINGVQTILGTPTSTDEHSEVAKLQKSNDAFKRWDRPTASLVVHYDLLTGHVKHFLIDGTNAPTGSFGSEEEALGVGGLKRDDANYSLSPITLKDPNRVWMVRITPTG